MGAGAFCDNSPQVHYRKHTVPFLVPPLFPSPTSPLKWGLSTGPYIWHSLLWTHTYTHMRPAIECSVMGQWEWGEWGDGDGWVLLGLSVGLYKTVMRTFLCHKSITSLKIKYSKHQHLEHHRISAQDRTRTAAGFYVLRTNKMSPFQCSWESDCLLTD